MNESQLPERQTVAELERTAAANPVQRQHQSDLAAAYADHGRWREAIQAYEKALSLGEANALLYNDLGVAYEEFGSSAQAELHYQKALDLEPTLAEAHFNLGLLLKQQRPEEAAKHLQLCIEFTEDSLLIGEARAELASLRTSPTAVQVAWAPVATTAGGLQAEFIASLLRSQEIPVKVWMEAAGAAMGLSVGNMGKGLVMVPEARLEEAQSILAAEVEADTIDLAAAGELETEAEGSGWWNKLAKGMLGLAALQMGGFIGVILAALFARGTRRDLEPIQRCPHCHIELELDDAEISQGWFICPECGQRSV